MVATITVEEGEETLYIPGYDGRYRISTFGDILDTKKNRLLPKRVNVANKNVVTLQSYNTRLKKTIDRMLQVDSLVYKTFTYKKMSEVITLRHLDGNTLNDKFNNLEVVSHQFKNV